MSATPTDEQEQIAREENLAIMATARKGGSAQLTPINYAYVDGKFLVSTTKDRVKYHNVKRDAKVSLCIIRKEWRPYVTVYGRARIEEENIAEGTAEIFKRMSDRPVPENFAGLLKEQRRVLIIVTPEGFVS
jgi:PPOX class probable F420-dependent enzyme